MRRNPAQIPQGNTLVVGAGNSGAEIAIELAEAGRHVTWYAKALYDLQSISRLLSRSCLAGGDWRELLLRLLESAARSAGALTASLAPI